MASPPAAPATRQFTGKGGGPPGLAFGHFHAAFPIRIYSLPEAVPFRPQMYARVVVVNGATLELSVLEFENRFWAALYLAAPKGRQASCH